MSYMGYKYVKRAKHRTKPRHYGFELCRVEATKSLDLKQRIRPGWPMLTFALRMPLS